MDPGFGPPPPPPVLPPSTPPSPSGNNSVDVFFPPLPLFTPPQSSGESPPTDFQAEIPPAQLPPLPLPTPPSPTPVLPRAVKKKGSSSHKIIIIVGVIAGVLVLVAALGAFFLLRKKKVIMIKPWTARSSGLLQDEVVITGVPKLKLSELETACEDFSNIISSTSSDGTIYKGTLATGSEIAVLTVASGALQDWSSDHETQFQEKIHKLSQVDHKNFLNLIGYCHEDEPFNRMLVFEYAPYGSLSEHLHEQHTEQLDWPQRLRIAMGIAYCVEHMNNLNPKPISQNNLNSSSIYLTTDYAAKVSDFTFLRSTKPDPHISYVFSFGAILHEIITGKIQDPDSLTHESKPVRELLDPTLKSFNENVAERLWEVVLECLEQRIEMSEAVAKMRDITGMTEEAALPRLSPAWWAELEIISTEGT